MRRLTLAIVAATALLTPAAAQACPGCQNPSLPMARTSGVYLAPGEMRLGAIFSATLIDVVHDAGCRDLSSCDERPLQRQFEHVQSIYPFELTGTFEWGLSQSWGLEAMLPIRLVHTTINYRLPDGSAYEPLDAGIHHRDETLVGVGDPRVLARFATNLDGWWLIGRVGFSVPIGATEEDPFALGDAGKEHQHVQFGTGTVDPIVALELARSIGPIQLATYGVVQAPLYENTHGFQGGTRFLGGIQAGVRALTRLVLQLRFEYLRESAERWSGVVQQDGILGRQEMRLGGAVILGFDGGGPQLSLSISGPVVRQIFEGADQEAGDLSAPIALSLGAMWSL